jgi:hypothetical protein
MITKEEAWKKVLNIRNKTYGWCEESKNKYLFDLSLNINAELIIEIGIYRGLSLCSFSAASLVNNCKVIGIDSYINDYTTHVTQDDLNYSKEFIQKNFKEENLPCEFIFKSSLEASFDAIFNEKMIDILHIDGSHTPENSCLDVLLWLPKIKQNGFLILDDVNWETLKRAQQIALQKCKHICYLESLNKTQVFQKI